MLSMVSTGTGDDLWQVYHPSIYPGHSDPLSLAIPLEQFGDEVHETLRTQN